MFSTTSERDGVWREALLFVALAKIGQIFGLIAELRFWATIPGSLPKPFDAPGITPLGQLGADVWGPCETCDGHGLCPDDVGGLPVCGSCNGSGWSREPTRVDEALAVMSDWRMERGTPWRSPRPEVEGVIQNLRVLGPKCATEGCEHATERVSVWISFQSRDLSVERGFWREHCTACEEAYELERVADLGLFPNVFANSRDEPVVYDRDPEIRYTRQWPWIPPPDDLEL